MKKSKVIHISDKAHRLATAFCKKNKETLSDWVEGLVDRALVQDAIFTPVPKKQLPGKKDQTDDSGSKSWEQPAFYEKPKQKEELPDTSGTVVTTAPRSSAKN